MLSRALVALAVAACAAPSPRRPAPVRAPDVAAAESTCPQELGRDTGGTADDAAWIADRVRGCMDEGDRADSFVVSTRRGGRYALTVRALDDGPLDVELHVLDGEPLLDARVRAGRSTVRRFTAPGGSRVVVQLRGSGRYDVQVEPERGVAALD